MTNWPAIGIIVAVELVALGFTARALGAGARLQRQRDDDIRAAVAGFEAGRLIPALTRLVTSVVEIQRPSEDVQDALLRADIDQALDEAVDASVRSRAPRQIERSVVRRNVGFGLSLLCAQVAGPVAVYNVLRGGYNLPEWIVVMAATVFSLGMLGSGVFATLIWRAEAALANVIREGKDAA